MVVGDASRLYINNPAPALLAGFSTGDPECLQMEHCSSITTSWTVVISIEKKQ